LAKKTQLSIWHRESGELLARGPKGWGITSFEGNYYIRGRYLHDELFKSTAIPGLCPYKGIYHWLDVQLPEGKRESMLAWRYVVPNPLFPFIAFRIALPGQHPSLRYEKTELE
jgi:uncharacterized protein (DUF427 family)